MPKENDHVKQSLDRLEQAVSAIQDSETFQQYLTVQSRFWQYSWGNAMLIYLQRPDATQVAGYRTWQSLGRNVMRGEKAIRIIAPAFYKTREFDTDGKEQEVQRTFFRSVSVFDISQTDGKPLPEIAVPVLTGTDGAELYGRMENLALSEGLTVHRGSERFPTPTTMGYYLPKSKEIHVRETAMLQMTKTLAHEMAHHYAEHDLSRPDTETEAESVAYVVLARFGLDSGDRSIPYIATWAQDKKVFRDALGTIQRVSALMIGKLTDQEPHTAVA